MNRIAHNDEEIYETQRNQIGKNIENSFYKFLGSYQLEETDPNYQAYCDGILDAEPGQPIHYYVHLAGRMRQSEKKTMYVDVSHLSAFAHEDPEFMRNVAHHYTKYEPDLRRALERFMYDSAADSQSMKKSYFQIAMYNLPSMSKIRELRTLSLGRLMAIYGTVTRTTDAKPELILGTFQCLECGNHVQNVEQQFKYTEPVRCSNEMCHNKSRWELINKDSTMIDWQKIRIQEQSSDIPAGSMPRSLDVILRGEIVDIPKPGDRGVFTGRLVVVPDIVQLLKPGDRVTSSNVDTAKMKRNAARSLDGVSGLRKIGVKDLSYKMVFIASSVHTGDTRFGFKGIDMNDENQQQDVNRMFTTAERHEVINMKQQDDLYTKLARSIAPSVCGHLDVKKGVLLQLFGGIQKKTKEGIKLRGDINICIVGDPATAKSQFLKYICQFLPRAIYTSGKASSAAGLTASVIKDPETGDFCIEAGALMLADHGICCIDEFDKMDLKDQVAIHEAMEQQTISLAKAGIHATLNARASILAAANPIYGRYERSRSLRYNVNISPPIMSRFDIFFVIFDEKNDDEDFMIAQHIVNMHRLRDAALNPDFTMEQVQTYIKFCRTINPQFTLESAEILKEEYKSIRQREKHESNQKAYKVTVRQLESLVRLSEAIARAHCDQTIRPNYVREVCRLLRTSNINVAKKDIELDQIQEEINRELNEERRLAQEQAAAEPDAAQGAQIPQEAAQAPTKKVKISFDEYSRISTLVVGVMKDFERAGEDNVQQARIINRMVQKLELEENQNETSIERSIETSKKVQNVISYLIAKENLLMVAQDAKIKNERFLCLNINVDLANMTLND